MTARILIVDDDIDTIRMMTEILTGMGDLFFAADGAAAICFAQEKHPDIVLLDAEMPRMDGFEVCRLLKADPATALTTIIFVTAHADIDYETRALELGAVDFVSKPISPPVLRARVRNHIVMRAQSDELRRIATTDHLTRLSNRRVFDQNLDQEWRRAKRSRHSLAALMLDVDHFKLFNDYYGHPAGDACLQTVAQLLLNNIRRPGESVARYGGEEFAVLLPDTDLSGATRFADTLCAGVRAAAIPHLNSPIGKTVTISIGVAAFIPEGDAETITLITAADQALYEAKAQGRDRAVWKMV